MVYLGVDLGGTNIKVGVVTREGKILAEGTRPTKLPRTGGEVSDDIIAALQEAMTQAGVTAEDVGGIGVGCPGTVDDETGMVCYSNNLGWRNFDMRGYILDKTGWRIRLGNDANVAALGEAVAGCAKGAHSTAVITLGTGVGCGVVLEGKMLTGFTGAACELGHMVIVADGAPCTCGRKGCMEAYSSATGLIRMTKEAMSAHPDSVMHAIAAKVGKVSGRTAFAAKEKGDAAGIAVVEQYVHYLAVGLVNVINIFFPEVVALSGGVANEGDNLLVPLREAVYAEVFGGVDFQGKHTHITRCTLGYQAGIIGAAMFAREA